MQIEKNNKCSQSAAIGDIKEQLNAITEDMVWLLGNVHVIKDYLNARTDIGAYVCDTCTEEDGVCESCTNNEAIIEDD